MAKLLSPAEVAERLGLKPNTVLELARQGRIPRVLLSRRIVRFDWPAVAKALGLPVSEAKTQCS